MPTINIAPTVNVVVAPQLNVQIGLNLAVLSPGAQQAIGQLAGNGLSVGQRGRP